MAMMNAGDVLSTPMYLGGQELQAQIRETDAKFKYLCDQLRMMNRTIKSIQVRYDRANNSGRRSFRYSLRIRLCVLEGIRNMYYDCALKVADQLDELRRRNGIRIVSHSHQHQHQHAGIDSDASDTDEAIEGSEDMDVEPEEDMQQ